LFQENFEITILPETAAKDSYGNEVKYLYNVLFCVPVLVNTMAMSQHFPWQQGY
jgi:hypothetical protein